MLLMQLRSGVLVFDDATPAPIAGCITSNGAATVTMPVMIAGNGVGVASHAAIALDNARLHKAAQ